jgi:hypothetical protein
LLLVSVDVSNGVTVQNKPIKVAHIDVDCGKLRILLLYRMSIILISLFLVLSITSHTCIRSVSAGSLDIHDMIPDVMMGVYKDYELVHVEKHEEEDIVSIRDSHVRTLRHEPIHVQPALTHVHFF